MAWFSVDDSLPDHRKVRRLGCDRLAAIGVWTLCGAWAAAALSDGFVPSDVVQRHDPRERLAALLVDVDLWERATVDAEPGYLFHDWTDYQPTAEQVLARRKQRQEAGRAGGLAKARRLAGRRAEATAPAMARAVASPIATAVATAVANGLAKSCPLPLKAKTQPPTGVGARLASAKADAVAVASAQTIIADWVDLCDHRPPGTVIGQLAKQVKIMLDEKIDPEFVRRGLVVWSRKDLHPSTLPSVVNSVMNSHPDEYASPTDRRIAVFLSGGPALRALPGGQGP